MTNTTIGYHILLQICGILILLLFLPPIVFIGQKRKLNHKKRNLLAIAALVLFFALCTYLASGICTLLSPQFSIADTLNIIAIFLVFVSAVPAVACILCDEKGNLRLPKGKQIPIGQIACAVLPPVFGHLLSVFFPGCQFTGITWAISLHLIQNLILIESDKYLEEKEQNLERGQGAILLAQMQPHFIFNTLSAISSLCQTDAQAAAESIENLSGYLRGNIDALTSDTLIPFNDELRHIRQFISLEQADPSRKFTFDYDLDVRDFRLPALTVQPIVENAVIHGALTRTDGSGHVLLTTEAFGTYVRITVCDNGINNSTLTDAQQKSRGIGITNTQKRLEALCNGSLRITTDKNGTRAVILIPKK